ncbi:MAG: hypothetical protein ABR535_01140 [Pyrinomonadaceae bacterium]
MWRYVTKVGFAALVLLALGIGAAASAITADDDASLAKKVDELFSQWNKPDSPGCALGVVRDGRFVYKRGYGLANLDYNIPQGQLINLNVTDRNGTRDLLCQCIGLEICRSRRFKGQGQR